MVVRVWLACANKLVQTKKVASCWFALTLSVVVYLPQVVVSAEKVIWHEFSKPLPPPRRIMANFIPSGQLAPLGQTVQSISPGLSVSLLTQLTPWLQ